MAIVDPQTMNPEVTPDTEVDKTSVNLITARFCRYPIQQCDPDRKPGKKKKKADGTESGKERKLKLPDLSWHQEPRGLTSGPRNS
ncbi:hypothetical protein NPIL_508681 [Nephila pilipes]|uniref:Uncharacterized protein n=1 Tax=Nephila pilipes TaxID=299642 RepID=A0A8X6NK81_NEPPI|nr:hypothetical protein NPIL_508681 [Nephila pilipes]